MVFPNKKSEEENSDALKTEKKTYSRKAVQELIGEYSQKI